MVDPSNSATQTLFQLESSYISDIGKIGKNSSSARRSAAEVVDAIRIYGGENLDVGTVITLYGLANA